MTETEQCGNPPSKELTFSQFLESVPPGVTHTIKNVFACDRQHDVQGEWPTTKLHCPICETLCFCDPTSQYFYVGHYSSQHSFISYKCRHCRELRKHYSLIFTNKDGLEGSVVKMGELPIFGIRAEDDLQGLLENDKNLLEKGLLAESAGLGIAAFIYYRRLVEAQRTHLFDEVISISKSVSAPVAMIDKLQRLKSHWRFQESIDEIKDCVPDVLKIEGHNPFELLHPVLSDTIHDRSDEEALVIATEIRLLLGRLAKQIAFIKADNNELKSAVTSLIERKKLRDEALQALKKSGK